MWPLVTSKDSGLLECRRLKKSKTSSAGGDCTWIDWTAPQPEARQTQVTSLPAAAAGPACLCRYLGTYLAVAVGLSRFLEKLDTATWETSSTIRDLIEYPYNATNISATVTLTSQHTDITSNWNLAPAKMLHIIDSHRLLWL